MWLNTGTYLIRGRNKFKIQTCFMHYGFLTKGISWIQRLQVVFAGHSGLANALVWPVQKSKLIIWSQQTAGRTWFLISLCALQGDSAYITYLVNTSLWFGKTSGIGCWHVFFCTAANDLMLEGTKICLDIHCLKKQLFGETENWKCINKMLSKRERVVDFWFA